MKAPSIENKKGGKKKEEEIIKSVEKNIKCND